MKEKRLKHLYKGVFNFGHKVKILYTQAYSKTQAFMIFCQRISAEDNIPLFQVYNYFKDANASIEIEMEFTEAN